jgi:uncharacterized protein YbjT (DUF2867 family)
MKITWRIPYGNLKNNHLHMKKTALLLGSTGLIGGYVLQLLLADEAFEKVISFVRKPLEIKHPKLEQQVVDFDNPQSYEHLVKGDVIFCCLGTTIKTAGSQSAFKKVDYEYPLHFAKAAKQNGVSHYLIISSIGATTNTSNFYLRTKGEVEQELKKLNVESLSILRPSMLLGDRKEFRLGESIGKVIMNMFSFLFIGPFKKYKAIHAMKVAKTMVKRSKSANKGTQVIQSDEMHGV